MKKKPYYSESQFVKELTKFSLDLLKTELRDTGWNLVKVPVVTYTKSTDGITVYTPVTMVRDGKQCYGICSYSVEHGDSHNLFYAKLDAAPYIREIGYHIPNKGIMCALLLQGYNIDTIAMAYGITTNSAASMISEHLRRQARNT